MEALYLLIPLSVLAVFLIVAVLWWASTRGQFDDLAGPGYQPVMDDDMPPVVPTRFDLHQTAKPPLN